MLMGRQAGMSRITVSTAAGYDICFFFGVGTRRSVVIAGGSS